MKKIKIVCAFLGLIFLFCLTGCSNPAEISDDVKNSDELKVHFIDVGQADCILVQQGESNMLVDAGNNGDFQAIKSYLDSQSITTLDLVIGTHAHEDHIGSLDDIINSFEVKKIFFPKQTATTNTFKDFASAAQSKGLKLTVPEVNSPFNLGDAVVTILAPNGIGYKDSNDYSIVTKIAFKETRFLLTGDSEAISEREMLEKGLDLSATVLKISHHGSKSSTTQSFLDKVNPKYGVVSVGKKNSYGHPAKETMDRLKAKNVKLYRTDESGTIVATSNGKEVSFNTNPGTYKGVASNDPSIVKKDDVYFQADQAMSPVEALESPLNADQPSTTLDPNAAASEHPLEETIPTPETESPKQDHQNPTPEEVPNEFPNETPNEFPDEVPNEVPNEVSNPTVYTSETGSDFHLGGCSSLDKSSTPLTLEEALSYGLSPCGQCNPPHSYTKKQQ